MEDCSELEEEIEKIEEEVVKEKPQSATSGTQGTGIPDRDRGRRSFFSWFHNWVWNHEDQSLRGAFINVALTFFYLLLIGSGVLWDWAARNLREMETFLIGFYLVSFGVWATKKTVEFVKFTNAENIVNSVLGKVGIVSGSAAQDVERIKLRSSEDRAAEREAAR